MRMCLRELEKLIDQIGFVEFWFCPKWLLNIRTCVVSRQNGILYRALRKKQSCSVTGYSVRSSGTVTGLSIDALLM
jgi:hypothetical protein